MSNPYQFSALYPDLGDVADADPLLRAVIAAAERSGMDADAFNVIANTVLRRALTMARDTGQPLTREAFMALVTEHARHNGIDPGVLQKVAAPFAEGAAAGDPTAAGYDAERLAGIEADLVALEDAGKISRAEVDALAKYGQTVAGVRYIERLTAYAKGEGPAPAMPADLVAYYPPGALQVAPGESHDDDQPNTRQEAATMTDNHYPRVSDGPRHTETPEQAQARREHEDLRAKQNSVYSLMNDPRYSAPGSEGEVFRAEVARKFEEVFGSEASAGSSEPGLGV